MPDLIIFYYTFCLILKFLFLMPAMNAWTDNKRTDCPLPLSPARWHSNNTYLSSMGILGTEPACFPTQQPLL